MEFGEKIKHLREGKGMTQQTMAERLYVTRQAVSRWECGARFPDLLTAKKIAEILEVSIDELVSDEELKHEIGQEPVMERPWMRAVQTMLYTAAFCGWGLMLAFGIYSMAESGFSPGEMPGSYAAALLRYGACAGIFAMGLYQSAAGKLAPVRVGILMSAWYVVQLVSREMTLLSMRGRGIFYFVDLGLLLLLAGAAAVVFGYFFMNRRVSPVPVYVIAGLGAAETVWSVYASAPVMTDLGVVVQIVHVMGKLAFSALLVYQAWVLEQKRRLVIK